MGGLGARNLRFADLAAPKIGQLAQKSAFLEHLFPALQVEASPALGDVMFDVHGKPLTNEIVSLVMLSGGIDSTYVLVKLLRETTDQVLVHHAHLVTDTGRHLPEAASCKKIVDFCQRRYRTFFFTESTVDHRRFVCHGFDVLAIGLEAGMVAASFNSVTGKSVLRWTIGVAKDDEIPTHRMIQAERCCDWNCQQGVPPHLFLFPRVDVGDEVAYLPPELLDMTWSCRMPRGLPHQASACGECKSCKRRARARQGTSLRIA
jgi:hypothetical protein